MEALRVAHGEPATPEHALEAVHEIMMADEAQVVGLAKTDAIFADLMHHVPGRRHEQVRLGLAYGSLIPSEENPRRRQEEARGWGSHHSRRCLSSANRRSSRVCCIRGKWPRA